MRSWLRASCVALACIVAAPACSGGGGAPDPGSKIPGVVVERAPGRAHTQGPVDYKGKKPPSGGDHNPVPLTCGFYDQQPPDEYAVHSLEHGAVWIAHDPAISGTDLDTLHALARHPKVIVSPYAGLDAPVVLVAWEHRLEVQAVNDPRVQQFVDAYAGAPQAPEPSAACTGAGQPSS